MAFSEISASSTISSTPSWSASIFTTRGSCTQRRGNFLIIITSNNQRLRTAGDNDRRSKRSQTLLLNAALLRKFHLKDGQNTSDQITRGRSSKRAWSSCVWCIPLILSGSPNECWPHTCDACVITTWRLGLRVPLVARNYHHHHYYNNNNHYYYYYYMTIIIDILYYFNYFDIEI